MAGIEREISLEEEREVHWQEIEHKDLQRVKVIGKGSFGVVSKGTWQKKDVAIKLIETEDEKKAFRIEVVQLARVSHPNIVKLYGACTKADPVCLVMEFAEGGSLFSVLHGKPPQPVYTLAHALSWALQCAKGVAYLHRQTPKPLIHRDLKPANLLLMEGGIKLKICDFGTACDAQTYMTNNKGSAAWMAPEVFEGRQYNEKCDIFSWGIILWEVLSRKRPFDNIEGSAFTIMWAIHEGKRPIKIRDLPQPLDDLMNRCWSPVSRNRPSMKQVVKVMTALASLVKGADVPLVYPPPQEPVNQRTPTTPTDIATAGTQHTVGETVIRSGERLPGAGDFIQDTPKRLSSQDTGRVQLRNKTNTENDRERRKSADILELEMQRSEDDEPKSPSKSGHHRTHQRSSSHGKISDQDFMNTFSGPQPLLDPYADTNRLPFYPPTHIDALKPPFLKIETGMHHASTVPQDIHTLGQTQTQGLTSIDHIHALEPRYRPSGYGDHHMRGARPKSGPELESRYTSLRSGPAQYPAEGTKRSFSMDPQIPINNKPLDDDQMQFILTAELEPSLQPLPPDTTSAESKQIYNEHVTMAAEYMRLQSELALLSNRKSKLANRLSEDWKDQQTNFQLFEELTSLRDDTEKLQRQKLELNSELDSLRNNKSFHQSTGSRPF